VKRVLVTNDDGVESPGLHALAVMAHELGYAVTVAAPAGEASGSSASIIAQEQDGRVKFHPQNLETLPGVPVYAVSATPALIALIASRGAFGEPPELILSGVNHGANVGRAVLHSGTVGAALTGATYGIPALAVSLDVGMHPAGERQWDVAVSFAAELMPLLLELPELVAINVNVPDRPREQIKGLRQATLARFGIVQTNLEKGDDYVRVTIADTTDSHFDPGTDAALLAEGYASVTALRAVTEATEVELPSFDS
jgi:5'-nucleotidase